MDWLSQLDWGMFMAVVTAAAGLATAFSTSVVLWLRRRERAEADWAVLVVGRGLERSHSEGWVALTSRLTNAGDGPAFRVEVTGQGCEPSLRTDPNARGGTDRLPFVALIAPGEQARLRIMSEPAAWRTGELTITWTPSPTRLGKRKTHRMPLHQIAAAPAETDSRPE